MKTYTGQSSEKNKQQQQQQQHQHKITAIQSNPAISFIEAQDL